MSKYTPGQWEIAANGCIFVQWKDDDGDDHYFKIADVIPTNLMLTGPNHHGTCDETDANRRVMKEAPAMATLLSDANQALNDHFGVTDKDEGGSWLHDEIRALLARIEGE